MGKLVLLLGGPGSGKSRRLRELFMDHVGSARFIECRHKPESISHVFRSHSEDKHISYVDSTDDLATLMRSDDGTVFIDAPQMTSNEILALIALTSAYNIDIYAPLRVGSDGSHPIIHVVEAMPLVELMTVE